MSKFKFNILTGENAPEKYAAISPKDPFTFYLLETGQGYLGEKKMFDSVADTIDTINPDAPGTGIPTEAAIVNYVIEAVRNKVPYEIDGVPGGDLSGSSSGTIVVEDSPIGTIINYMGTIAPKDYLVCDGSEYNISQYPDLADFFEKQFGTKNHFGGNGTTTFAVPDLRNLFLRGYHGDAAKQLSGEIGAKQEATKIPNYGVGDSGNVNLLTDNISKSHWQVDCDEGIGNAPIGRCVEPTNMTTFSTSLEAANWYTTRPVNTAVLFCIKAIISLPTTPTIDEYDTEDGWHVRKWSDGYIEMFYSFEKRNSSYIGFAGGQYTTGEGILYPVPLAKLYSESVSVKELPPNVSGGFVYAATQSTNPALTSADMLIKTSNWVVAGTQPKGDFVFSFDIKGKWK